MASHGSLDVEMGEVESTLSHIAKLDLTHAGEYPTVHQRLQVARLILEAISPIHTTFDLMITAALQAINDAEGMIKR
jgi:hypothetical protein